MKSVIITLVLLGASSLWARRNQAPSSALPVCTELVVSEYAVPRSFIVPSSRGARLWSGVEDRRAPAPAQKPSAGIGSLNPPLKVDRAYLPIISIGLWIRRNRPFWRIFGSPQARPRAGFIKLPRVQNTLFSANTRSNAWRSEASLMLRCTRCCVKAASQNLQLWPSWENGNAKSKNS